MMKRKIFISILLCLLAVPLSAQLITRINLPSVGLMTADSIYTTRIKLTSTSTTKTLTNSPFSLSANSLTTGTGFYAASSSLTSGKLANLLVSGTAAASNTQTVLNIGTSGANATSTQTTYGLYSTNTHTGTASTNVGGYFSASGGTKNYGLIVAAGNSGFGTTEPTPHYAGRALIISGVGSSQRAMIELWDQGSGKALFQSNSGSTYIGSLAKGTGGGDLYLNYGDGIIGMTVLGSNGNVGFGTIAAATKGHFMGNLAIGDTATATADRYLYFASDGSVTNESIRLTENVSGFSGFYFSDSVSAEGYHDHSEYYEGDALSEILKIKSTGQKNNKNYKELDHKTLPVGTYTKYMHRYWVRESDKEIMPTTFVPYTGTLTDSSTVEQKENHISKYAVAIEEQDGRNVSNLVSVMVTAIQQLTMENTDLKKRIEKLEKK